MKEEEREADYICLRGIRDCLQKREKIFEPGED